MENFRYGTCFIYNGNQYCVVGCDAVRNEIECQTIPSNGDFYWFKVMGQNKVQLLK